MAEPVSLFTGATTDFIVRNAFRADDVSKKLGISANALMGAIANEHDTRFNQDLIFDMRGGTIQASADAFLAGFFNNQDIIDNYNNLKIGVTNAFGKFGNPAMMDVGPGNIKIATAIDVLNDYLAAHQGLSEDPLNLRQYDRNYYKLAMDMEDFVTTDATFAIAGLVIAKADNFFRSKDPAAWSRLTSDEQDAARVMFYKIGPDILSQTIDRRIADANQAGARFDFNPRGDGGQQHLNNLGLINAGMQLGLPGSLLPYGTPAPSPITPVAPPTISLSTLSAPQPIAPVSPLAQVKPTDFSSLPDFSRYSNDASSRDGVQWSNGYSSASKEDSYSRGGWIDVRVGNWGPAKNSYPDTGVTTISIEGGVTRVWTNSSGGWGQRSNPVILDIAGSGLSISSLNESSKYLDLDGNGYQQQTAWAGQGNGVLVLDADGDGKISRSSEFAFTEWDSSATTDLEALRHVFDTNGNGKLDAGDARWSEFRVEVNGQLVTLSSLGITSIDLTPTGSGQTFSDGSAITGTTTFTRADGTTGAVGDAVLATDDAQYKIRTETVTNADGSVTKDIYGSNVDGSLAFHNQITASADGTSISTQFDDDGNGTFDRSQTNVTTVAGGVITKTVSNFNADGTLSDKTATVTSADRATVTTSVDQDGDTATDQKQTYVRNADGSNTTTTVQQSINGTVLTRTTVQTSADGLTKTTSIDVDANGTVEDIVTEKTVIGSDGTRTKTVDDKSSSGKLLSRDVTVTSADNKTSTLSSDEDGDGDVDTKTVAQTTVGSGGDISVATSVYNGDGTLRGKSLTTSSTSGRSKTTSTDVTGDGVYDLVESDISVVAADGSITQTVQRTSANGSLLSKVVTTRSADGKTINESADTDGDGAADHITAISTLSNGYRNNAVAIRNADGSLVSKVTVLTAADGLSKTTSIDADGDGTFELVTTDVTTANADGSKTELVQSRSADGTLLNSTRTTTSADSLTQTATIDGNGDGVIDLKITDTLAKLADGKRTETVKTTSNDGTLLSQTYTVTYANRQNTTVNTDANGDGVYDKIESTTKNVDGRVGITTSNLAADGSLISKVTTSVSATGLTTQIDTDLNGDGVRDSAIQNTTSFGTDGGRTDTHYIQSGDGSLLSRQVVQTSGNGLSVLTRQDLNGDNTFDIVVQDTTVLGTDGSRTQTVTRKSADTTLSSQTRTVTSANGLQVRADVDANGDGTFERSMLSAKTLNSDGSITQTNTVTAGDASLIAKSITTVSVDGKTSQATYDIGGDGVIDLKETISVAANGLSTDTVETYKPDGTLASRAVSTVSANGLTKTSKSDLDGNGTFEESTSSTRSVGANGAITEVFSRFDVNSALVEKTTTVTSADGKTKSTSWADASGTTKRSMTDTIVLAQNGTTTETLSYLKADGSLESRTIMTTDAHGVLRTTTKDIDGNGVIDQRITETVANNGFKTQKFEDLTSTGAVKSSTTVTTSGNALSTTVDYDSNGDGTVDKRIASATSISTKGVRTTVVQESVAGSSGLALANSLTTTVDGKGLVIQRDFDKGGDGVDQSSTDTTTLNADGSRTQEVKSFNGTTLTSRYLTTTSANGLSVRREWDAAGSGTYSQISTDVTALNADGTKVRTVTNLRADGSVISKSVTTVDKSGNVVRTAETRPGFGDKGTKSETTVLADGATSVTITGTDANNVLTDRTVTLTSADKARVTIERDINGDGIVDQRQQVTTANTGVQTSVITDLKAEGTLADKTTTTVSADGRQTTILWDFDGNGTNDRQRIVNDAIRADGGRTQVSTDTDLATNKVASTATIEWSADGQKTTTTRDVNGDNTVDQTETVTKDLFGNITSVTTNNATARDVSYLSPGGVYWKPAIAARLETATSADGRTKTTRYDYDGDGVFEVVMQSTQQIDGSVETVVTETTAAGAPVGKGTLSTSADGLITKLSKDADNNGTADHIETSVKHIDGSITLTKLDLNTVGATTQTVVDQVNALGVLTSRITIDNGNTQSWSTYKQVFDGNGKQLAVDQANDDGSRVAVKYDANNSQTWSRVEEYYDTSNRLTNTTTYQDDGTKVSDSLDPGNIKTWSRYLQNINSAGLVTKVEQTNDDNSRITAQYDRANASDWSYIEESYDTGGRQTTRNVHYDNGYTYYYTYDAANSAAWSYYLVVQDASKLTTRQVNYLDNGGYDDYNYDPHDYVNGGYTLYSYYYNAATDKHILKYNIAYNDDNATKYDSTEYDYLGQFDYSSIYTKYKWNVPQSQMIYYDNNYKRDVRYDGNGNVTGWTLYNDKGGVKDYWPKNPVLLDLDGDGHIDLRPLDLTAGTAMFDWDRDGIADHTAWAGPGDGFLTIDLGADGASGPDGSIDQTRELSFALWADPDGSLGLSDLDGLRVAFDSNHDNVLDANDARWSEFRIWRDGNQNGVSDAGELLTMSEAGIKLVNLIPNPAGAQAFDDGSAITGTSSYETTNGQTHLVADATLAWQKNTNGVAA
ncbi:hypothetical protein [Rhizobium sp. BK379]|uniref:hypothetical protein n=1 Tax=Rhizobium sp. BK379 TaxID=2587059 RepID=UPI00183DAFFC|nr:hypothetical protein [Rhizobium sp. BK379]MBB3444229.1 hypothetical protein [Rhizobium sp. BK379]